MSTHDPAKLTLWAALTGTINTSRFYGLMQTGKMIASSLEGDTTIDKLAQFELGLDNMEIVPGNQPNTQFVALKHCPFKDITGDIPAWTPDTMKLVANYNRNPTEGGGALHPLCIVHRGIRENMPNQVVNLACRCEASGAIVVSESNLATVGMDHAQVNAMLEGKACLYCIRTDQMTNA